MAIEIFTGYNVTKKDLAYYKKLMADGDIEQAISEFIEKYIRPFVTQYESAMIDILQKSLEREFTQKQQTRTALKISAFSSALYFVLSTNFGKLANTHLDVLKTEGIAGKKRIANITAKELVDNFNVLTKESMTRTSQNILNNVRKIQRALLVDAQMLRGQGFKGERLDQAIQTAKNSIKRRFPEYEEMIKNKNFLLTRNNRNLSLDNYLDMSIRTTLLNVDRDIVENEARVNDDKLVEYILADKRNIKTEARQICQHILANRINGKALLALDQRTADKYGIMTVEQAKNTGDRAMGPNCRHSIRTLSKEFLQGLEAKSA